jgi:hypothetical protein
MAQLNLNLSGVNAQLSIPPLPPGWYRARVTDSEIKEGPKGNYIAWTLEIIGKPNKVWDRMSLSNEISQKRLKGLAIACGHRNPDFIADTEELHGKECMVRLKIEEDETGQYEPKNAVSAFKAIDGAVPTVAAASTTATAAPAAPAIAKPRMPWEKG